MSTDRFLQSLSHLLPQGFAWPRDPDAVWMRVLRGLAGVFAELDEFCRLSVGEWMPHSTVVRLPEWEEATGLPDACFPSDDATRRQMLLMRLRGPQLPFDDSSPAAPAVIEVLCASVGYQVFVAYNTPARCGHQVGRRVGRLDGLLYVTVTLPQGRARVGRAHVGDRLIYGAKTTSDLACLLDRVLPARFKPVFILV